MTGFIYVNQSNTVRVSRPYLIQNQNVLLKMQSNYINPRIDKGYGLVLSQSKLYYVNVLGNF